MENLSKRDQSTDCPATISAIGNSPCDATPDFISLQVAGDHFICLGLSGSEIYVVKPFPGWSHRGGDLWNYQYL